MIADWSVFISLCQFFYLCAGDDQEVTVMYNAGSGIQIGNNNTMIINEKRQKGSSKKPESVRPPAQSHSSAFCSTGPAAAAANSATKAPVIKKIVGK